MKTTTPRRSVKVGLRNQVTIPGALAKKFNIRQGSILEVREEAGALVFSPQIVIAQEDAWFWSPEWQKMEREADEDMAAGRISGPYTSATELIEHLNKPLSSTSKKR